MPSSSALRNQIEAILANKISAALSPMPRAFRQVTPTGLRDLDAILEGGLPTAAITELVGTPCSGRTSMALACIAAVTQTGNVCAWIDVADTLDPESVAANGVDLERLLWVRCGSRQIPTSAHDVCQTIAHPGKVPIVGVHRNTGGGSPHPRSEGRDMPEAISAMLQAHGGLYARHIRKSKSVGTPGAANRPLTQRSEDRIEQVNSDRLPPRRGDNLAIIPRCAEPLPRREASIPSRTRLPATPVGRPQAKPNSSPWQALDQALRTADLLLQSGGFSAIVLDLGSMPPEVSWRIPLATWFRFRAACERTRVSLLLLTQHPCARSSAEHVVRMKTGTMESDGKVMTGTLYQAIIERQRNHPGRIVPIRKQPQPERYTQTPGQWRSEAPWSRAR